MAYDALYHLNKFNPVVDDYKLGDELNKIFADLTTINEKKQSNMVLDVAAGLVYATDDDETKITNAFHYTIAGGVYLRAAEDNIVLANAGASALACAASRFAAYVVTVNATGAIALVKAADATSAKLALAAVANVEIADTVAPVGIIHIENTAGAIFTPGKTGAGLGTWDEDTAVDTYIDFVGVAHNGLGVAPTMTFGVIT